MALFGNKAASGGPLLAVVPNAGRLDVVAVEQRPGQRPRVTRCESYPLEGGLAAALTRLRQGGKLGGDCLTLLGPREYQFHSIEAPPLPDTAPQAELREAVRWKIKDMVDFPVSAASVDALPVPAPPGRAAAVLAAAASHAVLRPIVEGFQDAKATLTGIGVAEIAQRNIAALFETPDRALALLSFGSDGGLLTLTCNGKLYATRRLDISAADLAGSNDHYERAVLDVQRSLDNFDRNFSHLSLQRLLVLPVPGADDFVSHLRDNLYQPVESLAVRDGLDLDAAPMLANATALNDALPAIGLALTRDDEPGVNLFDPALQRQQDPWSARNLVRGLAAVLVICTVWGGWAHWRAASANAALADLQPRLQAARAEALQLRQKIEQARADVDLSAELESGRLRLQSRTEVLALLKKGMAPENGSPVEWLSGFARQIPHGLWLTGFKVDAESGALEIRGRTTDPRLIPEYLRRLNAEPAFKGRTFAALQINNAPLADTAPTSAAVAASTSSAAATGVPAAAPAAGNSHEFLLSSTPIENGGRS